MTVVPSDAPQPAPHGAHEAPRVHVLLYSDDHTTREQVRTAIGRRASRDTPVIEWTEVATPAAALDYVHNRVFDLLILDGETGKHGGMGVCRTIKIEVFNAPPVLLLIARPQDAWLASWSEAEGVISYPIDPLVIQEAVAGLLRETAPATAAD